VRRHVNGFVFHTGRSARSAHYLWDYRRLRETWYRYQAARSQDRLLCREVRLHTCRCIGDLSSSREFRFESQARDLMGKKWPTPPVFDYSADMYTWFHSRNASAFRFYASPSILYCAGPLSLSLVCHVCLLCVHRAARKIHTGGPALIWRALRVDSSRGIATPINKSTRKQPPLGACGVYATHTPRTHIFPTPLYALSPGDLFEYVVASRRAIRTLYPRFDIILAKTKKAFIESRI